jgi:hypothetical protein
MDSQTAQSLRLAAPDLDFRGEAPWCNGKHRTLSRSGSEFDSRRGYFVTTRFDAAFAARSASHSRCVASSASGS